MTTVLFHKGKMVADGRQMTACGDGTYMVTGNKHQKIEKINGKLYGIAGNVSELEDFLSAIKTGKTPGSLRHSSILEWDGKTLYKWTFRWGWAWPKKDWWFPSDFKTNRKRIGGYHTIAAIGSGGEAARWFYEQGKGSMEDAIQYAAEVDPSTNKFVRAATLVQEWIANNPYLGIAEPSRYQTVYSWTTTDTNSYANNNTIWIPKQDGTDINTWIHIDQHNNTGST